MSFNEGFSTQGIPYITGSDGQVLTWNATKQEWIASSSVGGISTVETSGNISGTGTSVDPIILKDTISLTAITASSAYFSGDIKVQGTASISLLKTIEQQTLNIGDKYITILSGANNQIDLNGAGILFGSASTDLPIGEQGSVAHIIYRDAKDSIEIFPGLNVSGSISASVGFSGDGSQLTNLPLSDYATLTGVSSSFTTPSQVSGAITASIANFPTRSEVTGALTNYITGAVTSGNISGSGIAADPIVLKDSISLTSVSATTISGTTGTFTNLTGSNFFATDKASINTYIQMLPVNLQSIPTNLTASYIYTSGSTNDMYFTQYQGPYTNTTRLRWMEGLMSTGLLKGGSLSTTNGTTTFNVAAGAGLIMTPNASLTTDPYPTLKYVEWTASSGVSLIHSGTVPISYISIDSNGEVIQEVHPPYLADYKTAIYLGRILHQSASVTNGATSNPAAAYGVSANTLDFIRSFGPLKINGHYLAASGSTLSLTKTSGDSYAEGRNYSTDQRNPNVVLAAQDVAFTGSKIFRQYMSGSTPVIETNNNAGYTTIDPTQYQNGTGLTAVPANKPYTVQRVYWFPKAVNAALFVYYGQATYASLIDAVAGITEENFTEGENTQTSAILVGYIVVKYTASDLTNTNDAKIVQAGLCRGGIGGSGGTVGAGASYLYQLNDVQIGTPNTGEALIYDYGLGKWIDGTPSNATNAVNATNAQTASYINPLTQNVSITGNISASAGVTGSFSGSNATFVSSSSDFLYSKKAVVGPSSSYDARTNNFLGNNTNLYVGDYYSTGSAAQYSGADKEKIIVGGVSGSYIAATEFGQTGSTVRAYMGVALGTIGFGGSSQTGTPRVALLQNNSTRLRAEISGRLIAPTTIIVGDDITAISDGGSYATGPYVTYPAKLHITSSNGDGAAVFAASSSTQAALRVSQFGTADAFIVEDETRPDSTPFIIKNDGKVGLGVTSPTAKLEVIGNISASAGITGSFSGDGSGLINIPASSINLTGYAKLDTANIFTANQTITGSLFVSSSLSTLDGLTGSNITSSNTLQVGGQSTFGGGVKLPIVTKTSNYSLNASTDYIVAFSGSNLTGTLPNSSGIGGSTLIIKNLHTSSLFITASAGTIDGTTSGITIYNQYTSYTFISDNTNWLIV
jgi:hypothetical protein